MFATLKQYKDSSESIKFEYAHLLCQVTLRKYRGQNLNHYHGKKTMVAVVISEPKSVCKLNFFPEAAP